MFVANHMTPNPITVKPESPVRELPALLHTNRIRHLPVVDSAARLIGIVTDRDVRSALGYDAKDDLELKTEDIMTADPVTVAADAPLEEALALLSSRRFGALPVVTGNQLVGIISRHDVLQAMYQFLGLHQPGSRIEVALPDPKTDLAVAFDALGRCEADLISAIAARVRDDGVEPALYLRISSHDPRAVENELRRAGLILLVPEDRVTGGTLRPPADRTRAEDEA